MGLRASVAAILAAMSKENVEIVRRAYEALSKGDYTAFFAAVDSEIELVLPEGGMNTGTHRGPREVRQFLEGYVESFDNFQIVAEEFFETGDQVVAFLRQSGRGRGSGIEIETRFAHVLTLRAGKVQRVEAFPDREKQAALKSAGLA
jgi:ketosteroid isomerase-like protein